MYLHFIIYEIDTFIKMYLYYLYCQTLITFFIAWILQWQEEYRKKNSIFWFGDVSWCFMILKEKKKKEKQPETKLFLSICPLLSLLLLGMDW